jgi:triacylglycerol lipase
MMSYHSIALSYLPRPDGKILTESPEKLVLGNKYASIPFIIGDQEDEGTLFSLFQSNLSTQSDVVDYLHSLFFLDATREQIADLVALYPNITTYGSPFRTGNQNNWYPQYKRLAAILGDVAFTLSRRAFLTFAEQMKPNVPFWSYLSSYDYGTPIMGTFHGSDIEQVFDGSPPGFPAMAIRTYYLSFIYDQDPNLRATGYMNWPQWSGERNLMQFFETDSALLADIFRQPVCDYLLANLESFHI